MHPKLFSLHSVFFFLAQFHSLLFNEAGSYEFSFRHLEIARIGKKAAIQTNKMKTIFLLETNYATVLLLQHSHYNALWYMLPCTHFVFRISTNFWCSYWICISSGNYSVFRSFNDLNCFCFSSCVGKRSPVIYLNSFFCSIIFILSFVMTLLRSEQKNLWFLIILTFSCLSSDFNLPLPVFHHLWKLCNNVTQYLIAFWCQQQLILCL